MSQSEHITGLVIRVRREGDVVLTLLSPERGRVSVIAKGARSMRSPQMALSQLFTYGEFELYRRGEMFWLNTGEIKENFHSLSTNLDALNLASYFCEVAAFASEVDTPADELLRLLLNTLHFLSRGQVSQEMIKGVYEWRVLRSQGIFPALRGCIECGREDAPDFSLDVGGGALICASCRRRRESLAALSGGRTNDVFVLLTPAVLSAIRFTLSTPLEKMLSFRLEEKEDEALFSRAGEMFLRYHLDAEFPSLQMYHQMKK
jgi:DNA repair protein RecO (recombination protein O)